MTSALLDRLIPWSTAIIRGRALLSNNPFGLGCGCSPAQPFFTPWRSAPSPYPRTAALLAGGWIDAATCWLQQGEKMDVPRVEWDADVQHAHAPTASKALPVSARCRASFTRRY